MSIALKRMVQDLNKRVEQMEKKMRHEFPEHRKVAGVSDPDPVPLKDFSSYDQVSEEPPYIAPSKAVEGKEA